MSVLLMCGAASNLGTFFVGILTQFIGAQTAVASLGILLILVVSICLLFLPWIRKIE
jgi:cellulose synthase/poly-beta-1,6-N-acetylglucosamine synthase-like glycosyltransferase